MTREEIVETIVKAIMENPSANDAQKEPVICDVCGHANSPDSSMCAMCSNYLEK